MSRQDQSAGDNSTQVQATGDVILGITEDRAHQIAEQTAREVLEKHTEEGLRLVQERILKLDDRTISSLVREGRLEVFADPGFQRSYRRAQEGAAVTDREHDYDLLTGLLIDRAQRGETRTVRAGIERCIEIIDRIDDEALRGLTTLQALQQYRPVSPFLSAGLNILEGLFSELVDGPLPFGSEWLDHLDILDAVRVGSGSSIKPFREYFPQSIHGYLASGCLAEIREFPLTVNGQPWQNPPLLARHELREGYVRFAAANEATLDAMGIADPERGILIEQARANLGFGKVDAELIDPFLDELRERPTLAQIEAWWNQIPYGLQTTGVGRILARANALRLDTNGTLPSIM